MSDTYTPPIKSKKEIDELINRVREIVGRHRLDLVHILSEKADKFKLENEGDFPGKCDGKFVIEIRDVLIDSWTALEQLNGLRKDA